MKKTVGMILLICIVVIVGPAKFLNSSLINHIIEKKQDMFLLKNIVL